MGVSAPDVTIAVPIVVATAMEKINGPSMLQIAVENTALMGESAFVATTVAIECEASLRPFTKFKASARMMPNRIIGSKPIMRGSSRCH